MTTAEKTTCEFDEEGNFLSCRGMSLLLDSVSAAGIGAEVAHVINFSTGVERDIGVYYKFTKRAAEQNSVKATKLMFNVCPFCRAEILKR